MFDRSHLRALIVVRERWHGSSDCCYALQYCLQETRLELSSDASLRGPLPFLRTSCLIRKWGRLVRIWRAECHGHLERILSNLRRPMFRYVLSDTCRIDQGRVHLRRNARRHFGTVNWVKEGSFTIPSSFLCHATTDVLPSVPISIHLNGWFYNLTCSINRQGNSS